MSFHDLSVELCTMVMQDLACQGHLKSLSSLSQACWSLYYIGNPILYDWNIKHQDCSGFERAVFGDRVDILKKFLQYGVPVNHLLPYSDYERVEPLWFAARCGSIEVVRHFFTLPNVDWNWTNGLREAPLHIAIQLGHSELAMLLLTHQEVLVNAEDIAGWTPLLIAVSEGDEELVEHLLAINSVNPDHRTRTGRSALFLAADWGRSAGVAKLLLDTGRVDVNLVPPHTAVTPLIAAIIANRPEIVELLLEHPDIDVNLAPNGSATPISIAAAEGNLEMVKILLEHPDIEPDRADDPNETPILRAANWYHEEVVAVLLADDRVGQQSRQLLERMRETIRYFEGDSESDASFE